MGDPVVVELVGALGPVYVTVREVITATRLVVDVVSVTVEALLAAPVHEGRARVEAFEVLAPAALPKTARVRRPRRAKATTETAATVAAGEGTDGG